MNFHFDYVMTIDGRMVQGEHTFDVINPATGAPFAVAPDCSKAQLDTTVEAARRAFATWRNTPTAKRQALVAKAGDLLITHADEMAPLFTREQGRPIGGAREEIAGAGVWMKTIAQMSPPIHVAENSDPYIQATEKMKPNLIALGGGLLHDYA